jgi:hypothetical protein
MRVPDDRQDLAQDGAEPSALALACWNSASSIAPLAFRSASLASSSAVLGWLATAL